MWPATSTRLRRFSASGSSASADLRLARWLSRRSSGCLGEAFHLKDTLVDPHESPFDLAAHAEMRARPATA